MFAVMGILAAINARHTTGRGQHIDISMLDCQLSMMNYMATMHSMSGDIPGPLGNSHFVHVPYNTFKTKTDMIVIACVGDQFWPPLLDLLDDEELCDSRFEFAPSRLKEKAYIEERINNVLINERAGYWLEKLENARIPCARVNNVSQAMSDPQIIARNMVVDLKHPLKGSAQVPGNPIKLSETNEDSYSPPPLLGAHNDEVLNEWLNKG
jgi:crotonobetainyl-CoA:carnitine CoA-transferase CaiB-like acyl-CoA transferase